MKQDFILLLNEGTDDEQTTTLVDYLDLFDYDHEEDFLPVINLNIGESCWYGADNIKRIAAPAASPVPENKKSLHDIANEKEDDLAFYAALKKGIPIGEGDKVEGLVNELGEAYNTIEDLKDINEQLRYALSGLMAAHADGGNPHYNDEYNTAKAILNRINKQ